MNIINISYYLSKIIVGLMTNVYIIIYKWKYQLRGKIKTRPRNFGAYISKL